MNQPPADENSEATGPGAYDYRKSIEIAGVPGRLREFPFDTTGRFGFFTTGGIGHHATLSAQMQCSVVTVENNSFVQFKPTAEQFAEAAFKTIPELSEAKQIIVSGPSGGGYVALSLGLGFARVKPTVPVRVVAFNPPTKVWPFEQARMAYAPYRELAESGMRNPVIRKHLEERGDIAKMLVKLWADYPEADFRALLVGSAYHPRDAWHTARLLKMPNIYTLMVETDAHGVHRMMTLPLERVEVASKLAKNIHRLGMSGMRTGQLDEAEAAVTTRVARELRARFPTLRSMFDWLDEQPAGDVSKAPEAAKAAG